mmetsp:Transcript_2706/g.5928  ORF Transcript_2706/g.5928 Transcript_2706/m.5928 type:complete len:270 (+) Transcript_2706:662-1471(+)
MLGLNVSGTFLFLRPRPKPSTWAELLAPRSHDSKPSFRVETGIEDIPSVFGSFTSCGISSPTSILLAFFFEPEPELSRSMVKHSFDVVLGMVLKCSPCNEYVTWLFSVSVSLVQVLALMLLASVVTVLIGVFSFSEEVFVLLAVFVCILVAVVTSTDTFSFCLVETSPTAPTTSVCCPSSSSSDNNSITSSSGRGSVSDARICCNCFWRSSFLSSIAQMYLRSSPISPRSLSLILSLDFRSSVSALTLSFNFSCRDAPSLSPFIALVSS